jgi:leucyl aminopeptidase
VYLARDLVNTPANVATPSFLAETAETLGREHGFKVRVIEADEAEGMGMGCFAAVFQGSPEPAKLIVIDAAPKGAERERPLVFVGKGVTFDTGGISIKPSAKMDEMKGDMAGAAAVLGFFEALGRLGAPRRVVGILPCTENMPGGAATRPGDVVTSYAGKTVEIVNTDAEGRLLLCDALTFAAEFDPLAVVDLATLTGACLVALGTDVAAVFSANDLLAESIAELGARVGDLYWRMPLWDRYFESLKSDVADMKNVGPREGGAVNAALFLKQFAPASAPWAHLDIAGPAFATTATALTAKGGTGFGVRTLLALVTAWEGAR